MICLRVVLLPLQLEGLELDVTLLVNRGPKQPTCKRMASQLYPNKLIADGQGDGSLFSPSSMHFPNKLCLSFTNGSF